MKPALAVAALAILALTACGRSKTVNVTRDVSVTNPEKTVVIHDDHHPDPYRHDDRPGDRH